MTNRKRILFLVPFAAATALSSPACFGAPASHTSKAPAHSRLTPAVDADAKTLGTMEQSYFQRTYDADPLDKRLRRLELFLTSESQDGRPSEQRIAMLKNEAARRRKGGTAGQSAGASGASDIGRLEQHILKKKFPNLDQNARLAALEKKVFGAAFPAIPAKERIARLKKTLGIGDADVAQVPPGYKVYRFNQEFGSANPFNSPFASPFGFSTDPDINRQMSDAFNQLNQQLRQMQKVPPGYVLPDGQVPHRFSDPYGGQSDQGSQLIPSVPQPDKNQLPPRLPPYMDPNSI